MTHTKRTKFITHFYAPKLHFLLINIAYIERLNFYKHKVNDSTLKQATEYSFYAS